MLAGRTTLTQYLIEERRRHPGASGELNALILDVALACKAISRVVGHGALGGALGSATTTNVHGETQKKLDVVANDLFLRCNEWGGHLAGMVSEEMEAPYVIPAQYPKGGYVLVFDPLDASSNIDVDVSVGSIFSILRAPNPAGCDRQRSNHQRVHARPSPWRVHSHASESEDSARDQRVRHQRVEQPLLGASGETLCR